MSKTTNLNDLVEVFLHKDDDRYKDDVVIILNGKAIVVPRGEKVKIKRKYALILEESNKNRALSMKTIKKAEESAM